MACLIVNRRESAYQLVRLKGPDFSMPQLAEMRRLLAAMLENDLKLPVALDTTDLELLGSACLSGIIDFALGFRRRGIPVFLVENRPASLDVIEIASLGEILPVVHCLEDGLSLRWV